MSAFTTRRVAGIIAWFMAFHVLLAYGLPEWLFISLALVLAFAYARLGAAGSVMVSITLVLVTLFYGLALKATGLEDRIYYRPDEKYASYDHAHNHRRYQKNVHVDMNVLHGDMQAMTAEDIAEPRRILFDTDSDGFRNARNYHGQRYLLVGDSFVAGVSNSQPDVLYAQLLNRYGIDAYSRAFPGNLVDYASYIHSFAGQHQKKFRALLFLFEGNDFDESRSRTNNVIARYGRRYYSMFSDFNTYRVTMTLYKRYLRHRGSRDDNRPVVAELAGKKIAFYKHYIDVANRPRLDDVEGFEQTLASVQPYLDRVYFIPDKYRVYSKHLEGRAHLPNAQWDYLNRLCRKYDLRCTNLTEPLVREADARLKRGKFIWWRDDTHWNRAGIAVAARVVASDIAATKSSQH
jgi:hypothetical protein